MESTNKTLVSAAGLVALVGSFVYLYISIIDGDLFSSDPRNQNIERSDASLNASQGQISTTSVNSSSPIDIAAPGHAAAVEVLSGKSVGDDLSMFVPQENKQYTGTIEEITENASGSTSTWHPVATEDFNGDGMADLLLRNESGSWWLYTLNSRTIQSQGSVRMITNNDWRPVSFEDFNQDSRSDVMIRNISSGYWWMYLLNGQTIESQSSVRATSGTDWQLQPSK